jgi:putative transcriptional regulator
MSRIVHHPSNSLLLDYAAGTLDEASSLLVATHLTLCPHCRAGVVAAEAIGGNLLDDLPAAPLRPGALDAVMARLDAGAEQPARREAPTSSWLPRPLVERLGGDDPLRWKWRWLGPGVADLALVDEPGRPSARMVRLVPGIGLPPHDHGGRELTLVLRGAFGDRFGRFGPGDVEETYPDMHHEPVALAGSICIGLVVTDARLRFDGFIARAMQAFTGV